MSFAEKLRPGQKEKNRQAFENPKIGDRFSEMFSFYVYVVGIEDGRVCILEGSSPVTFPDTATRWEGTDEDFRQRFSYAGGEGYSVDFLDGGHGVEGWLDFPRLGEP